jgi:ElaB/YqjD/DUF883 family membrane-anchored ribosome-binding protein
MKHRFSETGGLAMMNPTQIHDEFFRQGVRAWETAVEASAKLQEEGSKWLRQVFSDAGSVNDWCNKGQSVAGEIVAKAQENVDEAIRLVNQNAESTVRLMQKALDARQIETSAEARAKIADWCEAAMETALMNTQAVLQANSRILTAWTDVAKRFNGDVAEKVAEVAKKTAEQADKMARNATQRMREMAAQTSGNGG